MADRPILFSVPMVRSLLAGTKTQTRRALKFQPAPGISIVRKMIRPLDVEPFHAFERRSIYGNYAGELDLKIKRGDRLWVRENAAIRTQRWHREDGHSYSISYRADQNSSGQWLGLPNSGESQRKGEPPYVFPKRSHNKSGSMRWQPSIHMPKWASRLTLTVTDVRVERLQDISEADAKAEGVVQDSDGWRDYLMPETQCCATAKHSYRTLWDSINGEGSWEANPWIIAYTFIVQHGNIDQIARAA